MLRKSKSRRVGKETKFFLTCFIALFYVKCFMAPLNAQTSKDTSFIVSKPNVVTIEGVEQNVEVPNEDLTPGGMQPPALNLVQYRQNVVANTGSANMKITTSLGTKVIRPGSTDSLLILDDKIIRLNYGGTENNINVKENQKPKLTLMALYNLSSNEIRLSKIQKFAGYRVVITDDYADQLEFTITGPVKYKVAKQTENEIVINVTLDAFRTEQAFDNYAKSVEKEKYSTGFNIVVKDKLAPHKVSQMGVFYFTEW